MNRAQMFKGPEQVPGTWSFQCGEYTQRSWDAGLEGPEQGSGF